MPKNFSKTLIGLVIVSVVVFAIGAYLAKSIFPTYYLPVFPYLLLFFFLVNAGAHYFRMKANEGKPSSFPRKLMAINGIKIFVYLIFIAIYLFLQKENARNFLLGFLMLYFVYFIFEMFSSKKAE
ncbi:MAG: hypothetical protein U9R19_02805 [Bacteroidota bacterium]|nr:hypothetical protein [Bacteroidota bacterium]